MKYCQDRVLNPTKLQLYFFFYLHGSPTTANWVAEIHYVTVCTYKQYILCLTDCKLVFILICHYIYALLHGQFMSFILNFRTNNCKNIIKETKITSKERKLNLMIVTMHANSPVVTVNEKNISPLIYLLPSSCTVFHQIPSINRILNWYFRYF
jgi:hypothetical protein